MKIDIKLSTQHIKQIANSIDIKDVLEYINNNKNDYEIFLQNNHQKNINFIDNAEWTQKDNKLICSKKLLKMEV